MKKLLRDWYRATDENASGAPDDEFQFDENGELVVPDEIDLKREKTPEEIEAEKVAAEEEREARIAARALKLREDAEPKKPKEEPKKEEPVPVNMGDPDQDLLDRLASETNPVEVAKINRELTTRTIRREQQRTASSQTMVDQMADEFGGDDLKDFVRGKLKNLNKAALDQIAKDPGQRENLELMVEGHRAKLARAEAAKPPRSEASRVVETTQKFSASEENEVQLYMRKFGASRKEAEQAFAVSLRG